MTTENNFIKSLKLNFIIKNIIMKTLIELFAAIIQIVVSWFWTLGITFGIRLLIIVFSGVFGWIIGWFFSETFLSILAQLGITGFSMWQIGAFLGFVGSFFSPIVRYNNQKVQQPEARKNKCPYL